MQLLQENQPQSFKVLVVALPFRETEGSLTVTTQVPNKTTLNITVHFPYRMARVAKREVIGPTSLFAIDRLDQLHHRHTVLTAADRFPKRFPMCLHCFPRRHDVQIATHASLDTPVVPECVSKKIHAAAGLEKVNHLRFIPVQFETQPGFNLRLDESMDSATLVTRKNHKIVRIAHDPGISPGTRPAGRIKDLFEPVRVNIRQKRRYHTALCKESNYAK